MLQRARHSTRTVPRRCRTTPERPTAREIVSYTATIFDHTTYEEAKSIELVGRCREDDDDEGRDDNSEDGVK